MVGRSPSAWSAVRIKTAYDGRFFEGLEQGIGRVVVGFLETQEERHAIFGLIRLEGQAPARLAHLVHLQRAAFRISLDDRQVGMLHCFDLFAVAACPAGDARLKGLGAVQGLGETQGQRAASQAWGSREKICVPGGILRDVLAQHLHGPFVSE